MGYLIFVCGGLNLLMLGTTIFVLLKQHREDRIKPLFQRRGIPELKLLVIALYNLFNLMLEVIYFICIRAITNQSIKYGFFEVQSFMLDWYYLTPVWTILIMIPSLRQETFKYIYKKLKIREKTTVISLTTNPSHTNTI
uniref:Serpentine receptor class gamma n=1 Tax=Panagrolaimus davidi TaxID=227884 RepID=A0A914QY93_9BILA